MGDIDISVDKKAVAFPVMSKNEAMQLIKEQVKILWQSQFKPEGMTEYDALTVCFAGHELGMGPLESLRSLYSAKGRIGFYAAAMRRRVYMKLPNAVMEIKESTDEKCTILAKRSAEVQGNIYSFTMDEAKQAGLLRNPNWLKYPKDMLFARATSRACNGEFADALGAFTLSAEEIQDMQEPKKTVTLELNEKLAERARNGQIDKYEPGSSEGKTTGDRGSVS